MGIGRRIRQIREEKGLKQEDLANMIGVTKSAIGNYENEVSHPKEPLLYKLMTALECDANFLFQDAVEFDKNSFKLEDKEFKMVNKYRKLDDHGKDMIDTVLHKEYERVQTIERNQNLIKIPAAARKGGVGYVTLTKTEKEEADTKHPEIIDPGKPPEF